VLLQLVLLALVLLALVLLALVLLALVLALVLLAPVLAWLGRLAVGLGGVAFLFPPCFIFTYPNVESPANADEVPLG
jgi:hypothetical protein